MPERHRIAGPASGVPLATGRVGARVRIPLDSPPSPRWSRSLAAHLAADLTGHPAVGHLRLDAVVQGSEIVLEGVEPAEADRLGPVLSRAIKTANAACAEAEDDSAARAPNMPGHEAAQVARTVGEGAEAPPGQ
jgi:hypothetical protein